MWNVVECNACTLDMVTHWLGNLHLFNSVTQNKIEHVQQRPLCKQDEAYKSAQSLLTFLDL